MTVDTADQEAPGPDLDRACLDLDGDDLGQRLEYLLR